VINNKYVMKILKFEQYINEKLNIKPVSKDRLAELCKEPEVDDKTKLFIEVNNLVWNPSTRSYDCDGDVRISNDIVLDGKLKIRFGHVKGYFGCFNNKLITLEGAPQKVGGDFDCSGNKLKTLKGAPQKVGGDFNCSNNKLTTLEGAPKEVGDDFICRYNYLTTLKGAPQEVGGGFYCRNNKLTTIEGAPQKIGDNLYCGNNPNLVLPINKQNWIEGKIKK